MITPSDARVMTRMGVLVLAASFALLAGCGSTDTAGKPVPSPPSAQGQGEVIETPELAFGATHTYADGVKLTVVTPVRYKRTTADLEQALEEGGPDAGTRVTVTVVNGSKVPIDPSLIIGHATLDGQPVTALAFAPAPKGELRDPGYTLLPGQSVVFDELYALPGPGDLVLSFDHIETPKTATEMGKVGTAYFRGAVGPDVADRPAANTGAPSAPDPAPAPVADKHQYPEYSCDLGSDGVTPVCEGDVPPDVGSYEEIDPGLNVGPDGYCTGTPCGSNGQMPEMSCAELGVEEQFCGPDGNYTP